MASYKSHFSPPKRPDNQVPLAQRTTTTSRLPTRATTPIPTQSHIPTPSTSKLTKRRVSKDNEPAQTNTSSSNQKSSTSKTSGLEELRRLAVKTPVSGHTTGGPSSSRGIPRRSTSRSASKLEPPANVRTPSLVSGSTASTVESPRSVLRRKPSSIGKSASRGRAGSMSSQEDGRTMKPASGGYKDPYPEAVLGILPPSSTSLTHRMAELEARDPHVIGLEAPLTMFTDNLPPPTPFYALSASPSTRYSESPGLFSHASTPTSMSSHSPGLALSSKAGTKARQTSPTRNRRPVPRRKTNEGVSSSLQEPLASVRESSTSSSSASTVKASDTKPQKDMPSTALPARQNNPHQRKASAPNAHVRSPPETQRSKASLDSSRSPPIHHPPEFAHLLGSSPPPSKSKSPIRPPRPSRAGTADILSAREPSPIIQSNLPSLGRSFHRRQSSSESQSGIPTTSSSSKSRLALPSRSSSRNPSPNANATALPPMTSRLPSTRGPTPEIQRDIEKKPGKGVSPTPASPTKFTSRFGFFRRTKTEPAGPAAVKPEKKLRKGPMAGTGHEGYGKYSLRGRSGSTTSGTGSIGRSTSADSALGSNAQTPSSRKSSLASRGEAEVDDFFLDRLTPVVIRGQSIDHPRNDSQVSLDDRPSLDVVVNSASQQPGPSKTDNQKPSLLPSAMPDPSRSKSPVKKLFGSRRPSEEDKAGPYPLPSLAVRRSFRRSELVDDKELPRIPAPIDTSAIPSTSGLDSAQYSVLETGGSLLQNEAPRAESREGGWFGSKKSKQPSKPTRKWNFFQRAHASEKKEVATEVPVAVSRHPLPRTVAHYAMMSPTEPLDMEDLERIMHEADEAPDDPPDMGVDPVSQLAELTKQEHVHSILLPSPPSFPSEFAHPSRPISPKVVLRHPDWTTPSQPEEQAPEPASGSISRPPAPTTTQLTAPQPPLPSSNEPKPRPSRLPQVGRIPKVVSRRDQERQPPVKSFSRPFAPAHPRPTMDPPKPFTVHGEESDKSFAPLPKVGPLEEIGIPMDFTTSPESDSAAEGQFPGSEFFCFPPRKDSDMSFSSSSGILSFPPSTAVIPRPGAPPTEDEIWNEYDDLIDDVLSPKVPLPPVPPRSSQEIPFPCKAASEAKPIPSREVPDTTPMRVSIGKANTAPHSGSFGTPGSSPHLRRSRLLAILNPHGTPTTPMSISDFLSGYGDRNLSIIDPVSGRLSYPSTSRVSSGSGRPASARSSLPASLGKHASTPARASKASVDSGSQPANRYRDTRLIELAETQNDGLVSMANLRFGALMTSKWLSFGRVLFSPAHFEVKEGSDDRLLIIDGLGKDWSYYCALTYPNVTIYNLGSEPSDEPDQSDEPSAASNSPWNSLPNHHHIHHPNISSPFPFPKGFFAAVVFRFPVAVSESAFRAVISECKRVLRPGGYLEVSILDLDMANMGNRARRAVRSLKIQLQVADPEISLKPASDNIQRLLGRRGFENLNRCVVGVPAAGGIPGSSDEGDSASGKDTKTNTEKSNFNYSEILRSPSSATDTESITRMVARVGRWWYSRCYESIVTGGDFNRSIWADNALIRECEKRGTSFRLLICYAQKPTVVRRRTVSV